jgi:hypothetical protein
MPNRQISQHRHALPAKGILKKVENIPFLTFLGVDLDLCANFTLVDATLALAADLLFLNILLGGGGLTQWRKAMFGFVVCWLV